ncbi:MAG: phosphatidylethanolamine/phosphatidyl-N-methylethanolamine N-methyltransferase [Glaciecola sp.]
MSTSINSIANFYSNVKLCYEPLLYIPFNKGRKIVASELNNHHTTILELGCNQGQLAKLLTTDSNYLGIDVAKSCINKAIESFKDRSNIKFINLNGEDSNLPEESFDAVVMLYVLSVSPNPSKMIYEAFKLLKPGGKLFIVNHFSKAAGLKRLDQLINKVFFPGVKFYFPISLINQMKGFNIAKQKKVNFFWTYLELKKT